ncbi:MAG: sarcosine oxidase subunit delta [Steroidobacteraceae bacterium]
MRIECPFCGERDLSEFTYLGAAGDSAAGADAARLAEPHVATVYLRSNPAGAHRELWRHGYGCGSWLEVTRDTRTHLISAVRLAKDPAP